MDNELTQEEIQPSQEQVERIAYEKAKLDIYIEFACNIEHVFKLFYRRLQQSPQYIRNVDAYIDMFSEKLVKLDQARPKTQDGVIEKVD